MTRAPGPLRRFVLEGRRRGVFRAAAVYAGLSFLVWQVADIAFPALGIPGWAMSALVVAAIVLAPVVVAVAWKYDLRGGRLLETALLRDALDPAPVGPAGGAGRLPVPTTPFVGRERERAELARMVQEGGHRLVTIVGHGGLGKTRLALEVARSLESRFPDGAAWVALDGLASAEAMLSEIARALGVRREPGSDVAGLLRWFLAGRSLLLVLDGFEELAEHATPLNDLLASSPETRILVTSRVRLALRSAAVYRLGGMSCAPGPDGPSEGALLFAQAATRRGAEDVARADAGIVRRICELVDGIPLGIELAASWTDTMALPDLAEDLESGLDLLESRDADVPVRQRSLDLVLGSTWQRLGRVDRETMTALAVFEGPFDADDAARVAGTRGRELGRLAGLSLLQRTDPDRFVLTRTLRQHVRSRAPSWPPEELSAAHAAWVTDRFTAASAGLRTSDHERALARMEEMLPDLERAWTWICAVGDLDQLGRIAGPAAKMLEASGRLELARRWLARAVAAGPAEAADADHARTRGYLLALLGHFDRLSGRAADAVKHLHAGLDTLASSGAGKELAFALYGMGDVCVSLGRYDEARRFCQRAEAIYLEIGDAAGRTASLNNLGVVAHLLGDDEEARRRYAQSLEACREAGDRHGAGFALNNLGALALDAGDPTEARRRFEEASLIGAEVGDEHGEASATANLARVDLLEGDLDAAATRSREARARFQGIGDPHGLSVCEITRGDVALARSDLDEAEDAYRSALATALALNADPLIGEALVGLADVRVRSGRSAEAAGLLAPTVHCRALDKEAAARRDHLLAELATPPTSGYVSAGLHETARAILSTPAGA